jgi:Pvc16 N-terminal domain
MLDALDSTLELLLKREFPPDVPSRDTEVFISFDTPYQGAIKKKPAINFFLYDVQENLELRSSAWSVERQNGTAIKKRPPARVDCSYLITAWAQNDEDVKTEHQLLGAVMKVLLRHRKLPESSLADNFEGQDLPLRLISLRPSNLQSFGEFWQAMGGKEGTRPKVVLHCTATISVPVDEAGEEAKLVGVYQPNA